MRESCLDCARKHIGASEVLMNEALLGYPMFPWYAVGHLEQAEEELLSEYPDIAEIVRAERIKYIDSLEYKIIDEAINLISAYKVDTHSLLMSITFLACENAESG